MAESDRADDLDGNIANSIVAIVLAAGAGSRFSGDVHKLLAPIGGSTVIGSSLSNVLAAGFSKVIVVTGAASLPDGLICDSRLALVHNERWSAGQASSLRVGIDTAHALGADAVVVGLGDQPFIEPEAWRRVAEADSPIAVASYAGRRGHPVKLERSVWAELPTDGDFGARDLISTHPDKVSQVDCPGSATDIDTQEDLEQWT